MGGGEAPEGMLVLPCGKASRRLINRNAKSCQFDFGKIRETREMASAVSRLIPVTEKIRAL